jgi:hypothetical protein
LLQPREHRICKRQVGVEQFFIVGGPVIFTTTECNGSSAAAFIPLVIRGERESEVIRPGNVHFATQSEHFATLTLTAA